MSPVTQLISCCSNCDKVRSLAEKLIINMQAFEVFTMEMELDLKSAKLKSREVIKNFWELILMVKSITIVEKKETGKDLDENQNTLIVNTESHEEPCENEENENDPVKSPSVHRMRRRRQKHHKLKNGQKLKRIIPHPNAFAKRLDELQQTNRLLRTIKCETGGGFYNLFECVKCQRQFNSRGNGRHHIKTQHLNLGTPCPTCKKKYFTKESLELHIPKCYKRDARKLKQIKIQLQNQRKKHVKVHLQPHENQQQKQADRVQRSVRKYYALEVEKPRKMFDPLRLKVKNPYKVFSLKNALNVKVVIERLHLENIEDVGSSTSQSPTSEKTNDGNEMRNEFM